METRQLSEIIFRDDLYPRIKADPATIQRYAEILDVLPPIEINQHNELIDGFHRFTAYRKMEKDSIPVMVTPTSSEIEFLKLAIQRNAAHGLQMNEGDKKSMAIRLYAGGTALSKEEIATTLSVTTRAISGYLSDIDKQLREERKQKIYDMWLAGYTTTEIAESVNVVKQTISSEIENLSNLGNASKNGQVLAEFGDEGFEVPLYNVWTFAKNTNEIKHFGNSEQRILENLLYLYTKPFDLVIDPFAGGGATIDVCKKRLRRYWISDRKPIVERENEIRMLDIVSDLPPLNNRWSDVKLVYLDPPYWRQALNQYSQDAEDMANMPLEEFTNKIASVVMRFAEKMSNGIIAMLMQPTQWNADNHNFTDHIVDILRMTGNRLTLENRISCPYSTQQATPQMVNWAKENKKLLVLSRELIVWKVEK